ncbi:glycyl-radical enzyme activating protein [Acerihabitans sp. KWT182]|uniref:Glycyl-radical enzyme activating protein n=1 Tax=Acerihabitans sp. KWT182 TaxID=3157919 RepID=A0AAU7QF93_9GAMM
MRSSEPAPPPGSDAAAMLVSASGMDAMDMPAPTSGNDARVMPVLTSGIKSTAMQAPASGMDAMDMPAPTSGNDARVMPVLTSGIKSTAMQAPASGFDSAAMPAPAASASRTEGAVAGWIFNIQRYSLHDGEGIRTLVFLKGCPLRCAWCSNPESQEPLPEITFDSAKCLGNDCGFCLERCPTQSLGIDAGGIVRPAAQACGQCRQCVAACPTHALHYFGERMTATQVMDSVEADSLFYARSRGGVTLSGGEPLMQADFALLLLREAKKRHIDTTLETCGYGPWPALRALAGYCDGIYFDIKSLNDAKHRQFTRRSNRRILANLSNLRRQFPQVPIHVRTPLVPGFNDSREDIARIIDFIAPLPGVSYEILPYHRLGSDKYRLLGRPYPPGDLRLPTETAETLIAHARRRLGRRYGPPGP